MRCHNEPWPGSASGPKCAIGALIEPPDDVSHAHVFQLASQVPALRPLLGVMPRHSCSDPLREVAPSTGDRVVIHPRLDTAALADGVEGIVAVPAPYVAAADMARIRVQFCVQDAPPPTRQASASRSTRAAPPTARRRGLLTVGFHLRQARRWAGGVHDAGGMGVLRAEWITNREPGTRSGAMSDER